MSSDQSNNNLKQDRRLSIRTVTLPKDTNALGSIFGGYILSQIDHAAAEHARAFAPHRFVTKIMREVNFIAPVNVGDMVSLYTHTIKLGRTSITVGVEVEANSYQAARCVQVTSAEVIMVAVDNNGNPVEIVPNAKEVKN